MRPHAERFYGYLSANPVLLTAQRIRAIVDNGLHELVLSIDGVTPETSEAVRGKAARNVKLAERRVKKRRLFEYWASVNWAYPRVVLQIVRAEPKCPRGERVAEAMEQRSRGGPG